MIQKARQRNRCKTVEDKGGGLRGLEQKKRRRCRGGQEVCSLSARRMGRRRVTSEKARRGGRGVAKKKLERP